MKFLDNVDVKANILDNAVDLDTKYEPLIGTKLTAFNKDFGTTSTTIAVGNHGHPGIAPGAHASTHLTGGTDLIITQGTVQPSSGYWFKEI